MCNCYFKVVFNGCNAEACKSHLISRMIQIPFKYTSNVITQNIQWFCLDSWFNFSAKWNSARPQYYSVHGRLTFRFLSANVMLMIWLSRKRGPTRRDFQQCECNFQPWDESTLIALWWFFKGVHSTRPGHYWAVLSISRSCITLSHWWSEIYDLWSEKCSDIKTWFLIIYVITWQKNKGDNGHHYLLTENFSKINRVAYFSY